MYILVHIILAFLLFALSLIKLNFKIIFLTNRHPLRHFVIDTLSIALSCDITAILKSHGSICDTVKVKLLAQKMLIC